MRAVIRIALAWLVLLPATASAQAVITGTVRDTSGAILPGIGGNHGGLGHVWAVFTAA